MSKLRSPPGTGIVLRSRKGPECRSATANPELKQTHRNRPTNNKVQALHDVNSLSRNFHFETRFKLAPRTTRFANAKFEPGFDSKGFPAHRNRREEFRT